MKTDIYVLVSERDTYDVRPDSMSIIHEQYVDKASFEEVKARQASLGNRYGTTRIARLVFVDDDGNEVSP